jgi:hypothetical protein
MSLELMALILECDMIQNYYRQSKLPATLESDASKQLPNF